MAIIYEFPTKPILAIPCLVCGEPVPISEEEEEMLMNGREIHSKICYKCQVAIRYTRANLFKEDLYKTMLNEIAINFDGELILKEQEDDRCGQKEEDDGDI